MLKLLTVYLALDGTGFCPVRSSKTLDAIFIMSYTFSEFITRLSDTDVKNELFNSYLSHWVLLFNLGHVW